MNNNTHVQSLPVVLRGGSVGSTNLNGISAFSISPSGGVIMPDKESELSVTFMPDHASIHYLTYAVIHISDEVDDLMVCDDRAFT